MSDSVTGRPARPKGFASALSSTSLQLSRIGGSISGTIRTVGLNISKHVAGMVRHRGKANIQVHPLSNTPQTPRVHVSHESSLCRLPYEIEEMIVAYAARDLNTIKACSLACRSWYSAAVAHVHHTLLLREKGTGTPHRELEPLSKLHELGLIPLVKEIRIRQWDDNWFQPQPFDTRNWHNFFAFPTAHTPRFDARDRHNFFAFTTVHTLRIHELDINRFLPTIGRYFEGFLPTLRSMPLYSPRCTPRQLSFFFSHFPNLNDIEVW